MYVCNKQYEDPVPGANYMPSSFSVAKVNKMQGGPFIESGGRQWDVAGRELLLSDPILCTLLLVFNAKQGCFLLITVNPRKKSFQEGIKRRVETEPDRNKFEANRRIRPRH